MRWQTIRRGLQTIHLWVGLILCIPIVIVGLTGSVLIFQRELLRFPMPAATAIGERATLAHIIEAASEAAPNGATLGRVDFSPRAGVPVAAQFQTAERPPRNFILYIDPVSLKILSDPTPTARSPLMTSIMRLHEFLWLPPIIGLKTVGWVGVAMTFMGFSGLVLWWPRKGGWRRAFLVRKGARGLALNLDLHHAFGIWSSAIFLVMSISGLYLAFPETVSTAFQAMLPAGQTGGTPAPGYVPAAGPADADIAVASAAAAVPDARAVSVQMPDREGRPIVVYMEPYGLEPATPPILVTVNKDTAKVGYIDDPRLYGIGEKILNWQYALHFGVGVGWLWQALVFFSGLAPLLFAVTGVSIWWMRRRRAPARMPEGVIQPAE